MYTVLLAVDKEQRNVQKLADVVIDFPGSPEEKKAVIVNVEREFDTPDEGERVSSEDMFDASNIPKSVTMVKERLDSAGIETTIRREHGEPSDKILEIADVIDADNIVIGGKKRSPAGKALFGSVTQSVILEAERPVTVIQRE
ncbi:universal stress protein UspA [Halalkaliarchaeum desulfuricum]|uniref:Universal stress protein UspA n=1 Tax=Halalkaliarchaeum desulfuricum TaxID=2055893 RepID=A0A343THY0_9EURY|nr:universal stress protein [Halalkaliarchaeum desulfuricum]AUX08702.1 universal stress protein UspA [Halalkaliarchaeum desulfuricum]